jgi:hypothetical protein
MKNTCNYSAVTSNYKMIDKRLIKDNIKLLRNMKRFYLKPIKPLEPLEVMALNRFTYVAGLFRITKATALSNNHSLIRNTSNKTPKRELSSALLNKLQKLCNSEEQFKEILSKL